VHICPLVPALGKGTPRQLPRFQAALTGIDLGNGLSLADLRMTDPVGAVRSRRLAAATPRDDLLVFCVHDAGFAAAELIGMALRDLGRIDPSLGEGRDVLLGTMRRYVRAHLADSRLSVAELARQHHVSVRYLHALFARIGTTPAAYVREQRLQAARALLDDPAHDSRPISSIAASAGFTELTTFERAFQRRCVMTPGSWLREHRLANPVGR
jgi:AraC-like DNA-binding protein